MTCSLTHEYALMCFAALDNLSPHNWLEDNIWLRAYHQWRVPLLVNSNWWAAGTHDPTVPKGVLSGAAKELDLWKTGITRWQVRRAAWLAYRVADLYSQIHRYVISIPTGTKSRNKLCLSRKILADSSQDGMKTFLSGSSMSIDKYDSSLVSRDVWAHAQHFSYTPSRMR